MGQFYFRIIAKIIDFCFFFFILSILPFFGIIAAAVFLLLSDAFFDGQSPGKKIFGLKVYSLPENSYPLWISSVIRNSYLAIFLLCSLFSLFFKFLFFCIIIVDLYFIATKKQRLIDIFSKVIVNDVNNDDPHKEDSSIVRPTRWYS